MTQATHTPGPWHIDGTATGKDLDVYNWEGRIAMIDTHTAELPEVMEANARLIAAAPNLLAALETLLEGACEALSFLDRETVKHLKPLIDTAEAAIAKAKGA